jgi:hypothetical protein
MTRHTPRTHLQLEQLPTLEAAAQATPLVKAHANPHRTARGVAPARDARHDARRALHDVERGVDPDELP